MRCSIIEQNAPGCSISGIFKLRKVAGNFHIALGKNLMANQKGVTHTSNTPKYQFTLKIFRTLIRRISYITSILAAWKQLQVREVPTP